MNTYEKRLQRTLDAVHMKKVDKIPFSYSGPAYMAHSQGLAMAEYLSDFPKATTAAIGFCVEHPGIDTLHTPTISPYGLSMLWYSQVKIPGKDLPADELWQLDEKELMTRDDYRAIIKDGYAAWSEKFLAEKLDNPAAKMLPFIQSVPETAQRMAQEAQIAVINGANAGSPIESFCGARQLTNFFIDLIEEPELVKAAMDKAFEVGYANYCGMLDAIHPIGAWIGGWRAAPQLMNHETWMEFCWPYLHKYIDATVERGVLPILHFDSCWDREIETLLELPAQTCLLMLDGFTDMRRARSILGDHMALMGDVPATKLAFGTADEVYDYVTSLIEDVGSSTGLVVSSGCDCPLNAKKENVEAMIQATVDYHIA